MSILKICALTHSPVYIALYWKFVMTYIQKSTELPNLHGDMRKISIWDECHTTLKCLKIHVEILVEYNKSIIKLDSAVVNTIIQLVIC